MKKHLYLLSVVLFLSACAHNQEASDTATANEAGVDLDHFRVGEGQTKNGVKVPEQKIEELEIIPTEINGNVEKWINYFQGRGRPHMERYLLRSTRYEA